VSLQRALQHLLIIAYLAVTFAGLTYTLLRVRLPLPWTLVRYSYGMMGPFESYNSKNPELVAEGLTREQTWEPIDLGTYFPTLRGERSARMHLLSYHFERDWDVRMAAYTSWALQVLKHEQEEGREIVSVRLFWEEWPVSPAGYEALRTPVFAERQFITQVW
jgi:hypothetical protein